MTVLKIIGLAKPIQKNTLESKNREQLSFKMLLSLPSYLEITCTGFPSFAQVVLGIAWMSKSRQRRSLKTLKML